MRVSVAITNYNYGQYVAEAVASAARQTHTAFEIVVVDDGSTDNSRQVLEELSSEANVLFTPNRGVCAATTTAVQACSGDVVALLDADDLMLPTRIAAIVGAFEENPSAQWVFHSMAHIDRSTGARLSTPGLQGFDPGLKDLRVAVSRGLLPMTTPATSALAWRGEFLQSLMPLPAGMKFQDSYLKFVSMGLAPGCVVGEELSLQGIHAANLYSTLDGSARRVAAANDAMGMLQGLRQHGLKPLGARLMVDAAVRTRGGLILEPSDRRALVRHLRQAGPLVLPWFVLAAVRAAVRPLRSRLGRRQ